MFLEKYDEGENFNSLSQFRRKLCVFDVLTYFTRQNWKRLKEYIA